MKKSLLEVDMYMEVVIMVFKNKSTAFIMRSETGDFSFIKKSRPFVNPISTI